MKDIYVIALLASVLIGTYVFISLDSYQKENEEIEKQINNVRGA